MEFNKQEKRNLRGGITVFSSLVLASIFFLNGLLLDWARVATAKANLPYKVSFAGNSLLAGFDGPLFRDYCLIACREKSGAGALAKYYFTGMTSAFPDLRKESTGFRPGALLPVSVFSGDLEQLQAEYTGSLADINVLQKSIIDTMQYRTPANVLSYLLEALDLVKSAEKMSEGEALFQEAGTLLEDLSDGAERLYRLVEGWSAKDISCVNGFDDVPARAETHAAIKADAFLLQLLPGAVLREPAHVKELQRMRNNCQALLSDLETYRNLNAKAIEAVYSVRQTKERCAVRVSEMETWLSNYMPENDQETDYAEKLRERISELRSLMAKLEYQSALKKLEENLTVLETGIEAAQALNAHLDAAETDGIDGTLISDRLSVMECTKIHSDIKIFTGGEAVEENLAEQDPRDSARAASDSVLSGIPDTVAIEESLFRTLPSLCEAFEPAVLDDSSIWKSVLIDDYILTYFHTAAGKAGPRFSYFTGEAEYILNGAASEADNLESTQNKILLLRTVLNLQHVVCNKDKMNLARAIGNAIAGALTCGIGGPLFAALVAGAWALGEAALDVRDLKEGKEVPLLKTEANWKLCIAGLADAFHEELPEDDVPFALDYNGYLRILLLMMPQKTKLGRIADLLELNFTKQSNQRCYLGDFYTGIKLSYFFSMPMSSAARWFLPGKEKRGTRYAISGEITLEY